MISDRRRNLSRAKWGLAVAAAAMLISAGCAATPVAAPVDRGSGGKPTAPVEVRFQVPAKLAAGVPITVSVQVMSKVDADELQVQWRPSAGLVLGATPNPTVVLAPVKGRSYLQTVTVTASADGEYFLSAQATLRAGAAAQTRVQSARLNVGSVSARAKPALTTDSQQTPIESLPAQESVPK